MRKNEFVEMVAEKAGISKKDADAAVEAVFSAIGETLAADDKLSFHGFGTFEVRDRAARKGRDIRTGEPTVIAACRVPVFRPSTQLKEKVNQHAAG